MTDTEKARYEVLKLANENGKFAVQLGTPFRQEAQILAFEEMQITGWVRLIDVTPIAEYPDRLFRVFLASPEAMAWFRAQSYCGGS